MTLEQLANLLVDGGSRGSIYALLALAVVFTYRSVGLVNFAQGELATLTTVLTSLLLERLPPWFAVAIGLASAFLLGVAVEYFLFRSERDSTPLTPVVTAIGLVAVLNSMSLWIFGAQAKPFPSPFGSDVVTIGDVAVSEEAIGIMGTVVAVTVALALLFRFTSLGLAFRATAQSRMAAELAGIRTKRIISMGWGMSAVLGAGAGVLIAPSSFVQPNMMQTLLVYAFIAAVLGGLESPIGAVLGGLAVGISENLAAGYEPIGDQLKTVAMITLFVCTLAFRPQGLFAKQRQRRV